MPPKPVAAAETEAANELKAEAGEQGEKLEKELSRCAKCTFAYFCSRQCQFTGKFAIY